MSKRSYINKQVRITWIDSTSYDGWNSTKMNFQFTPIVTHGTVISESKDGIAIAATIDHSKNECLAPLNIPRGCIKKITRVRKEKP